mmetsp:Transcript_10531/g.16074  ORF Transcript_10531/g.16074 Transcript_10531/m.16074 type:complete len:91 (+) Transcript_10531:152-424(+)
MTACHYRRCTNSSSSSSMFSTSSQEQHRNSILFGQFLQCALDLSEDYELEFEREVVASELSPPPPSTTTTTTNNNARRANRTADKRDWRQ